MDVKNNFNINLFSCKYNKSLWAVNLDYSLQLFMDLTPLICMNQINQDHTKEKFIY